MFTNAGSSSGVLVKSKSAGSITLQFVTYATVVPPGLTITQIQNLPTTLNGASVTVTVGATVVHPALYYATPQARAGPLTATGIDAGTADADIDYDAPVTFR